MTTTIPLALVLAFSASTVAAERAIPLTEKVHTDRPFELQLIAAIRDFVPHVMRAKGTPGLNLAIGHRDRLIWEAGFGWADVVAEKLMTPETVYHSGSLGKTYTATAVMHLVDRGVLSLEDPINDHLPFEVHNPLGDRPIIIQDLLTHKSGLSSGGARGVWGKPESLREALEKSYQNEKSPVGGGLTPFWVAKVGARFNYSNPGIATLGLIVETANPDDLSFADYVQKHVMDPLGMESSQYPPALRPRSAPARGGADPRRRGACRTTTAPGAGARPRPPRPSPRLRSKTPLSSRRRSSAFRCCLRLALLATLALLLGSAAQAAVTLTNGAFVREATGARWSAVFPGVPPHPRVGHNAMIDLERRAEAGNGQVPAFPDRVGGDAITSARVRSRRQ